MKTISFIGTGRIATAIIEGALDKSIIPAGNIGIFDRNADQIKNLEKRGCKTFISIQELVKYSDIVLIAVKPQSFTEVLPLIKEAYSSEKVLVSVAAGISESRIECAMEKPSKIILAMPNTPALLAQGATALAKNGLVSDDEFEFVKTFFMAVGIVEQVELNQLNLCIAINGSTPAYVYDLTKIIVNFAAQHGVEAQKAKNLFIQTLIGSAHMLRDTGKTQKSLLIWYLRQAAQQ